METYNNINNQEKKRKRENQRISIGFGIYFGRFIYRIILQFLIYNYDVVVVVVSKYM